MHSSCRLLGEDQPTLAPRLYRGARLPPWQGERETGLGHSLFNVLEQARWVGPDVWHPQRQDGCIARQHAFVRI